MALMLRRWRIKRAGKQGYIILICPSCGLRAWVNRREWLAASEYKTRPCTGCFRTFRIPTVGETDD